ncbi:MAG: hypothetical protein AAF577_04705 [Pseudomonadota bacterium]
MALDHSTHESPLLKAYDPEIFDQLNDFPEAKLKLRESTLARDALGSVICKYGFEDVIAVNLLHKHFDIGADEIVLRRFESDRHATMRPCRRVEVADTAVPYLWAFADGRDGRGWYPLEFLHWPGGACADVALLCFSDGMLEELGEEVIASGMADTFGIAGLFSRHSFVLGSGTTLLETTDEATRTLDLRVVTQETLSSSADTTQTLWIYSTTDQTEDAS